MELLVAATKQNFVKIHSGSVPFQMSECLKFYP